MNDLETKLRDSLQSAPTPQPRIGDPVAAVERRATRARAFIAGGAIAVAAVVTAAIVVPVQLSGHSGGVSRLGQPPTTAPVTPASHRPQVWFEGGSVAMTSGGGSLWHLHRKLNTTQDIPVVDRLDPVTHHQLAEWTLQEPADFMAYAQGRVWAWGGGDGGYPDGLLQSIDTANSNITTWSNPHQAFNGVAFAAGSAWATTAREVWQLDASHGAARVSTTTLSADTTQQGIVTTQSGQLWVRTEKTWVRIDPASHRVVDSVQWDGPMLGAAGGDAIWTYDGRLIALSPTLLHQGISVAEGSRITVPGLVASVAASSDGGLFVVAYSGQDASVDPSALYYLSERQLTGTARINDQTPNVADVSAFQLAADNAGGVNYTNSDVGTRWVP